MKRSQSLFISYFLSFLIFSFILATGSYSISVRICIAWKCHHKAKLLCRHNAAALNRLDTPSQYVEFLFIFLSFHLINLVHMTYNKTNITMQILLHSPCYGSLWATIRVWKSSDQIFIRLKKSMQNFFRIFWISGMV